jgi:hypothetical protein
MLSKLQPQGRVFKGELSFMITPEQHMKRLILALCDELHWGLRFFYAAKVLYKSELRLTTTMFNTFYWSCLDQCALILSRMVVAKAKFKDDSVNVQYLLEQAKKNPQLFHYSKSSEMKKLVEMHFQLLESYKPVIDVLEVQRDRNLTHLDLKHVKQPKWRENQTQLDLNQVEKLYQDLAVIIAIYYKLFFDGEIDFGDWQTTSQAEIEFYETFKSKN